MNKHKQDEKQHKEKGRGRRWPPGILSSMNKNNAKKEQEEGKKTRDNIIDSLCRVSPRVSLALSAGVPPCEIIHDLLHDARRLDPEGVHALVALHVDVET